MMKLINAVSDHLVTEAKSHVKSGEPVDLRTIFGKFTMDSIASCAFGVDSQSYTNKNSKFVENAKSVFTR